MDANVTILDIIAGRMALSKALLSAMDVAEPMQWGVDDCALWCANILRDALGYDAAASFRGRYRTRIGAHRVLGRGGLANALRLAGRRHHWRRCRQGDEQIGDVGIAVIDGVASTVICRAQGWFVGRNAAGWTALPSRDVRLIWAVLS